MILLDNILILKSAPFGISLKVKIFLSSKLNAVVDTAVKSNGFSKLKFSFTPSLYKYPAVPAPVVGSFVSTVDTLLWVSKLLDFVSILLALVSWIPDNSFIIKPPLTKVIILIISVTSTTTLLLNVKSADDKTPLLLVLNNNFWYIFNSYNKLLLLKLFKSICILQSSILPVP